MLLIAGMFVGITHDVHAQRQPKPWQPLQVVNGTLQYQPDTLGNRIPDFSYAGYKAAEQPIPFVPVKVTVPALAGDATRRIQAAIDYVARLPLQPNGFRGAVLLLPGTHTVAAQIKLHTSGIVLRGSGCTEAAGTRLLGAGTTRQTLIAVGTPDSISLAQPVAVTQTYVPVNALYLKVDNSSLFAPGDNVVIKRLSTQAWIDQLGTAHFGGGITALGWKPGTRNLIFYRKVKAIQDNNLLLDAPITTALDKAAGPAEVQKIINYKVIFNVGIENLQLSSAYDSLNLKDEDHRWDAISMQQLEDGWVRQVVFKHFAGSAVRLLPATRRITVEDCVSLEPVSEIGGQRRYTFFTEGQQTLFQRCYAEQGYHDFATGFCTSGPNAFVQCQSTNPYSFSGTVDSWASGVLFDVVTVDGQALSFANRGQDANGAGWAAANSVFWNCNAARIDCYQPPGAQNYAFGSWSQFAGNGYWAESNNSIEPRSLYYAQLAQRLPLNNALNPQLLPVPGDASSSPTPQVAAALSAAALQPAPQLLPWILNASQRNPIDIQEGSAATIDQIGIPTIPQPPAAAPLVVKHGVLVQGNTLLTGSRTQVQWWSGGLKEKDVAQAKPHITRFVPGKIGPGFTDDLQQVVLQMKQTGIVALEHNYGLWYDRRRDDHQRVRRMDGEVWPPFYEQPFSRSGIGTAWDGLSKYDLTKYNQFYWSRLQQFAYWAQQQGRVLLHHHYFQHNILEAGAHYADFPWRTANNINQTQMVEPVNYAGDKRIFYAQQFYDTTNAVRRALHRAYIRKCLTNFENTRSVIHLISEEYTGPLHFVQFWLNVIAEYKAETGYKPIIALSTTKDVQDSILSMPQYANLVDVIDIRYWHYQADGSLYAPLSNQQLAPRQHARLLKPKKSSFQQVYRAVAEYRNLYPDKAVVYSADSYTEFGMAGLMGGGRFTQLPATTDEKLVNMAIGMKPLPTAASGIYRLTNGRHSLVYNSQTKKLQRL